MVGGVGEICRPESWPCLAWGLVQQKLSVVRSRSRYLVGGHVLCCCVVTIKASPQISGLLTARRRIIIKISNWLRSFTTKSLEKCIVGRRVRTPRKENRSFKGRKQSSFMQELVSVDERMWSTAAFFAAQKPTDLFIYRSSQRCCCLKITSSLLATRSTPK